jgi:hypothetical protein
MLGMVMQSMAKFNELLICVGEVIRRMDFMVVDTYEYDVLLGFDSLIKIGVIINVEQSLIQIWHGPRINVQVLPLNMVNMLQMLGKEARNWKGGLQQDSFEFFKDC